jgi:hypothetical protein
MHQRHEDHLEALRIDIVAFDFQVQQIGVVLRDELRKGLCTFPADDKIIENESFCACLIYDEFLNALSFIMSHFKK